MKIGSLFSGYGGLDLAVSKFFDADVVWHSEIEPAPAKVLRYRFPSVPNLGDVTQIDWTRVEPVDIICGGSPCQDVSLCGPRNGMHEGTRSGLWASMREGIAVLRPTHVVWENVKGAYSAKAVGGTTALGRVVQDLTALGYSVRWGLVRASDAGAPHRRERVFVWGALADTPHQRPERAWKPGQETSVEGSDRGKIAAAQWADFGGFHPEPLVPSETVKYGRRLNPRFSEWVMGLPSGWVTDVPGITSAQQLKMLGNGVVPQQALLALDLLEAL